MASFGRELLLLGVVLLVGSCGEEERPPSNRGLHFVFDSVPASATWGSVFLNPVLVTLRNEDGEVYKANDFEPALSIITENGAVLLYYGFLFDVEGRARAHVTIDRPTTARLVVSGSHGVVPDTSGPIEVGGDPPSRLWFTAQPAHGVAGRPFRVQPQVGVFSASGRQVRWFEGTVSISAVGGSLSAQLAGTRVAALDSGIATFKDLSLDLPGPGYTLLASSPGLTLGTSVDFDVVTPMDMTKSTFLPDTSQIMTGDSVVFTLVARDSFGVSLDGLTALLSIVGPAPYDPHCVPYPSPCPPHGSSLGFDALVPLGGGTYRTVFHSFHPDSGTNWEVHLDGIRSAVSPSLEVVGVAEVSTGSAHTCAVLTNARLYCWGAGADGRLGTGGAVDASLPVAVGNDIAWTAVSAGWKHTCAISTAALYCWGDNSWGQLASGDNLSYPTPHLVTNSADVVQVATGLGREATPTFPDGGYNTCVRRSNATIWCAGDNRYGQLGVGTSGASEAATTLGPVIGWSGFSDIALGATMACGRSETGVVCWGENSTYQSGGDAYATDTLCVDGAGTCRTTPTYVLSAAFYGDIDAGVGFVCRGGTEDMTSSSIAAPYCWGKLYLEEGWTYTSSTPRAFGRGRLAVGADFICSLVSDNAYDFGGNPIGPVGGTSCWGSNDAGQLGDGSWEDRTAFGSTWLNGAVALDAGARHACMIVEGSQALLCWGANESGQLGDGTRTNRNVPVPVKFKL